MRTNTARWLSWILGVWIVSWGLMFPAPAGAACALESVTSGAHHPLEPAMSAPSCDQPGGGDRRSILDDQDDLDADVTASIGPRDTQFPAPVSALLPNPFAISATRAGAWHSASIVEPRYLRYGRLLY